MAEVPDTRRDLVALAQFLEKLTLKKARIFLSSLTVIFTIRQVWVQSSWSHRSGWKC